MIANREQQIRERAYELWARDGRIDGCAEAYWLAAEREFQVTQMTSLATKPAVAGVILKASKQGRTGRKGILRVQ